MIPIRIEPNAAERQVAAVTAGSGMPVFSRIDGLTTTMYAMVKNVVTPASTSVRQSVPSLENSK